MTVSIQPSAVSRQPSAVSFVAQALALAFRPRYANGHAVRTTLGGDFTQHYSNAYLFYSKAPQVAH
ncbi:MULTISPECIES: hypothetical protein [Moorena]|uniref:hypothetical protein n=1 Tax=Moorena TaxID=1155738 RepID=UPI0012B54B35|nr:MULTISPECIES: hypothetical protein [Moorena]NEP34675.1 hypothetical protein [Moorena sp. SIO3B2]NEP66108.1 hypothetical protein [Moorena sp. SIO3A5]NEQ08476.1 hypothetical protein [Moorena sp. SIO4E2]NER90933.1 hypothetical protein [Moorena sp. SIO3A2]